MQYLDPNRTFPARNDGFQSVIWQRVTINFNDAGIASAVQFGSIPQDAFIVFVIPDIETVFNAVTTNVLTIGTTQANANELVAAGDVNEAAVGATSVTRGLGRSLTAAGDVGLWAKYTQTGTAATAGRATCVIGYIPPNSH